MALQSTHVCACVSLSMCVFPEYRVIFSMALPHKIFTWPSIMDCDLIEAECSHHAPSVNSPHERRVLKKTGFGLIFWDSGANLSARAEAESLRIFFLKLLKSYSASCVGARRSCLRWWIRVNVCTTWQRSDFCILYFMLQPLLRALTTFPPSNWTAKSKSNLDSQNTHISRHEAYFWPHVEKKK